MSNTRFESLVASGKPIVIDGGLATQLETQGCDINNALWSASVISSNPQAIVDAHRAFLEAGAQIIIAASYQATDPALLLRSIELAIQARDEFQASTGEVALVVASVGPYGAVQSDGSEYTGDYGIGVSELKAFHAERLALLDGSGADVLACETIPSIDEATALSELLLDCATPAWISFSCRDGERINDGATIESAAELFREHANVQAVGVNCTQPRFVESLISRVRSVLADKAIVVYPNSGEEFDADDKTWSGHGYNI